MADGVAGNGMTEHSSAGRDTMRARMRLSQILNMNFGFFGIQFSFGLQQANMSPIYSYLGADEASLPLLWLAGPMTGLLVQPIIGALSDRTTSRLGRRTPYFLIGAIICSLCLIAMPHSAALWMAAGLLWILDAANNVTMEPYRAFVSDKLDRTQHAIGFLSQSAFTGLAQTLAYLSPSLFFWFGLSNVASAGNRIPEVVYAAFAVGAVLSIASIAWSVYTTRETPLTAEETVTLKSKPFGLLPALREVWDAAKEMPPTMKQLALVYLFQWYALFCYWQYITLSVSQTLFGTTDATTQSFRDAGLLTGQMGAFYNFISFASAFAMVPIARKLGSKPVHAACLALAGVCMWMIPSMKSSTMMFLPMIGIGLAWASIMGNPYVMLAGSIPPERTGVYMGIFNMFIVIPMMIQIFTLPLYYKSLLGGNPENAIRLGGVLMLVAAGATLAVKMRDAK